MNREMTRSRHARLNAGGHASLAAAILNDLDDFVVDENAALYHAEATAALAHATLAAVLLQAAELHDPDFLDFAEGSA